MYKEIEIRDRILDLINSRVEQVNNSGVITKYRSPVIGFASAHDPLYDKTSEIVGYPVAKPTDLLENAKTVISFFLPYTAMVVKYARARREVSNKEWSLGYYETNNLIGSIMSELVEELHKMGIDAASEPVTENYDHIKLTATWGHKTSAAIAGIGTFGINRLVITPMGCAGRLGTVVMSAHLTPTERPDQENCYYKADGTCGVCAKMCPSKAITYNSFNRFVCKLRDDTMRDSPSPVDRGCYFCSSGPCAFFEKPRIGGHHVWIGRNKCESMLPEEIDQIQEEW
ncbi:MAG: epoxyqueuosine reductase [Firmicutes bacterium]|nr:epoxyqueuosine reductase [Bacillota bacterium]